MNEFNFFQIPHVGVDEADRGSDYARTDVDVTIRRALDMKLSNFGARNVGLRISDDYTRTVLAFKSKDELADINVLTEDGGAGGRGGLRSVNVDVNPYVIGSTVKKIRDDQFFRMDMDNNVTGNAVAKPKFDVMDTKEVSSGMVAYKNYPSEGWRSFGGKYDFEPYTGVL
jgi:hypothetical protein